MNSVMIWFVFINVVSTALCLWTIYEAQQFIITTDELTTKTLRRINDVLDQCLELEDKHVKRP